MARIAKQIVIENGDKNARIATEMRILSANYTKLSGHRKTLSERLIRRAATLLIMVEDLELFLLEHGCVDDYNNGAAQSGRKQSAESQAFSTYSKQYSSYIKQLDDLLPSDPIEPKKDDLTEFITEKPMIPK